MEIPGVFFDLGIFNGSNTILWNIQGLCFFLSGIFRGKVKKWKTSGGFQNKYILNPPYLDFFCNSPIHRWQNGQHSKYSVSWMWRTKRVSIQICILLQAFQNFSRLLIGISELITNLKYTFNIPFRINLKTIIMGTSSQFHDGAQLKFYPHLAQRYCTLLDWVQETFVKGWSSPGAIALLYPTRVRVRATVKLSAAFCHDESSITKGRWGGGGSKVQ